MSSNFNKHANRAASVRLHCGFFCFFSACVCGATTITNAPLHLHLLVTHRRHVSTTVPVTCESRFKTRAHLPAVTCSLFFFFFFFVSLFKWLDRSCSCSAFHSRSSMFAARWMDGEEVVMDGEEVVMEEEEEERSL